LASSSPRRGSGSVPASSSFHGTRRTSALRFSFARNALLHPGGERGRLANTQQRRAVAGLHGGGTYLQARMARRRRPRIVARHLTPQLQAATAGLAARGLVAAWPRTRSPRGRTTARFYYHRRAGLPGAPAGPLMRRAPFPVPRSSPTRLPGDRLACGLGRLVGPAPP
jgi:hypothetical protein